MNHDKSFPQRIHNPFSQALVTELIEDPKLYKRMFSEEILVSETLEVFRPNNVIVTGPLGSGKSMLLNLIRYKVLSEYVKELGRPPGSLHYLPPFLGISINLVRANCHAFGRRSIAKAVRPLEEGNALDVACAADFLIQYLFHDFLNALKLVGGFEQASFAEWLGISPTEVNSPEVAVEIASWRCWRGYYSQCCSLDELIRISAGRQIGRAH